MTFPHRLMVGIIGNAHEESPFYPNRRSYLLYLKIYILIHVI
jgi:hypothetical protein